MKKYKKVYIEITNICNLSCDFCPKTNRPKQFMGKSLFEEILHKLKGYCEYLFFHVMGEPLLHPDLDNFLDLCLKYNYKVNITTNGTLIEKVSDTIIPKPALRQINFSLHSFDANTHNITMDSYLDKIFKFIKTALSQRDLLISLRLWNLSQNGYNEKNIHVLQRIEKEFELNYPLEQKLTPCNGLKLSDNVFLNQATKFDWPDLNLESSGSNAFCYGLRDQLAILVDGSVVPCCLDREGIINLGNIKEQSLEDIINSQRATQLYEGFSRRHAVEELCRRCGYRSRFN